MYNFEVKTTLPFPFFKMEELVTHTEVRNPTGIAFLILVLLKESKDKSQNFADLLKTFGIPEVHHSIIADELNKLINGKILNSKIPYNRFVFSKYMLSNFEFTDLGNKVFREEQIPTGKEKEKKIECYYDIALNQLSLNMDPKLELKTLFDNAIDESFFNDFRCEKNVEDFLNANKGQKIQIKKEEVITKVENLNTTNFVGKYTCKFIINDDKLDITFENSKLDSFFKKNYTDAIINKAILLKRKFNLNKQTKVNYKNISNLEIKDFILPEDFNKLVNNNFKMVVANQAYNIKNTNLCIYSDEILSGINEYADVMTFTNNQVNVYCPIILELNYSKKYIINLPIVFVLNPSFEKINQAFKVYFNSFINFDLKEYEKIVYICDVLKDTNTPITVLLKHMTDKPIENINLLKEVKQIISNQPNIIKRYKEVLLEKFYDCIEIIDEMSLDTVLRLTSWIPEFLNINRNDVLKRLESKILNMNDKIKVFEILSSYFDPELVTVYVNPFDDVIKGAKTENKFLRNIILFQETFNKLKRITNIYDPLKYNFDENHIAKKDFKDNFSTFQNYYKKIMCFKTVNREYFEITDMYSDIFFKINDNFNVLEHALKNPNNIKKDLIINKINSGDYQFVLINLSAKLEILLKKEFSCDGNLSDMLKQAKNDKIFDKKIIDDLHELRINRNAIAHPSERNETFTTEDLRRWCKLVFDLEEK